MRLWLISDVTSHYGHCSYRFYVPCKRKCWHTRMCVAYGGLDLVYSRCLDIKLGQRHLQTMRREPTSVHFFHTHTHTVCRTVLVLLCVLNSIVNNMCNVSQVELQLLIDQKKIHQQLFWSLNHHFSLVSSKVMKHLSVPAFKCQRLLHNYFCQSMDSFDWSMHKSDLKTSLCIFANYTYFRE